MLNETGSPFDDEKPKIASVNGHIEETDFALDMNADEALLLTIQQEVTTVMQIDAEEFPRDRAPYEEEGAELILLGQDSRLLAIFRGKLSINSEQAYEQLDRSFVEQNVLPVFRQEKAQDVIYVVEGRPQPTEGGGTTALVLFLITIFTVLLTGTSMALSELSFTNPQAYASINTDGGRIIGELWRGLPYGFSILLILGAHELGHYFMSRYHGVAASLPYFLPSPFGLFGTFGAAIRLREPMKSRKILLDIGVAGPLAGMFFAVPILMIGLATSDVRIISGGMVEGNSIFYALAKLVTFGRYLPDGMEDVFVNQLAWAGWTGLFVTGLNLIPLGQLDGGHVMYSLVGKRARSLYFPIIIALGATVFLTNTAFIIILLLLIFMGRLHAVPLDDITPLDPRRRQIALFALAVFVLTFVPIPISEASASAGGRNVIPDVSLSVLMAITCLKSRHLRLPRFFRRTSDVTQ